MGFTAGSSIIMLPILEGRKTALMLLCGGVVAVEVEESMAPKRFDP